MWDMGGCVARGRQNPIGLGLRRLADGEPVREGLTQGPRHRDVASVPRSGIVATALHAAISSRCAVQRSRECTGSPAEARWLRGVSGVADVPGALHRAG